MALNRPSALLKNKSNIRPVGNRATEATAEDFQEIGFLLDQYAAAIDLFSGAVSPNPFYGTYTSLVILQAAIPVAEDNAYAIIDAGIGFPPQISLWDNTDNEWVLQITSATNTVGAINQGDHVTNIRVTDSNGDDHIIVSGTFVGTDPTKLEDYSRTSISRAI